MFRKVLVMVLFTITLSNFALAQQKGSSSVPLIIGVVDVQSIVQQMPEALSADTNLKKMQKVLQDTILKMQDALQKKVDNYLKQKSMMSSEQQQKQEQALQEEQQKLQQFYNEKLNEIQNKREELLEPIREKVKSAIHSVAKEENMSFVFDKGNAAVLFAEDKFDITFKVIDRIKRGGK
ncbi:MAG: OmpH family outer membrane protein [Candidatus Kapaibacteriales bacterium]